MELKAQLAIGNHIWAVEEVHYFYLYIDCDRESIVTCSVARQIKGKVDFDKVCSQKHLLKWLRFSTANWSRHLGGPQRFLCQTWPPMVTSEPHRRSPWSLNPDPIAQKYALAGALSLSNQSLAHSRLSSIPTWLTVRDLQLHSYLRIRKIIKNYLYTLIQG